VLAIVIGLSAVASGDPAIPVVPFDRAIELATARNPGALEARADIARASALVEQARAGSLPTVDGVASYTRLDGARYRWPVARTERHVEPRRAGHRAARRAGAMGDVVARRERPLDREG
jgi:outer membrane protein TolC